MDAEQVKLIRQANDMTQSAFARKLGYSRIAVNNWENKRCKPPANLLDRVAKAGMFTRRLTLSDAYGIYVMCRDQLRLDHKQALEHLHSNGDTLTTDDQLMLVRKYPSILEGREVQ